MALSLKKAANLIGINYTSLVMRKNKGDWPQDVSPRFYGLGVGYKLEGDEIMKLKEYYQTHSKRRGRPRKYVNEAYSLPEPTPEHDPRLPHPDALRFLGSNETYDEIAIRLIREGFKEAGLYLLTGEKA
jgi:hypothetical protein